MSWAYGSAKNWEGRLGALVQGASLCATAAFVWIYIVAPRWGRQSGVELASDAFLYVLLAWLGSAIITFSVYLVVTMEEPRWLLLPSAGASAVGMWFAPAMILFSSLTPAGLAGGLLLVAATTRLLFARWSPADGLPAEDPAAIMPERMLFDTREWQRRFAWRPFPALSASAATEAGVVAVWKGYPLVGAALFAASAAILTALAIATGAYVPGKPANLPRSLWGLVLTVLLAIVLAVKGVPGFRGSAAGEQASSAVGRTLSGKGGWAKQSASRLATTAEPAPAGSRHLGNDFPGVILWPEVAPQTLLVAPLPARHGLFGTGLAMPASIPFSGEYWLYQWPWRRPPEGSFFRRGSPRELGFRTTNGIPMQMEAHQKLDPAVDPGCCREIELLIGNADEYPVTLELTLIDSRTAGMEASLGTALAAGTQRGGQWVRETLTFPIPSSPVLRQFDQVKVVFRRLPERVYRSARIGIERIVLVPKGA